MKHKVEYLLPGVFLAEYTRLTIKDRSVEEAVRLAPDNAYCFTIYDVEDAPDLGEDFDVVPMPKNRTKRHYLGGELFTPEEIEALPGDHSTLIANARGNDWPRMIRCRTGNWQPFEDGDVVVAPRS